AAGDNRRPSPEPLEPVTPTQRTRQPKSFDSISKKQLAETTDQDLLAYVFADSRLALGITDRASTAPLLENPPHDPLYVRHMKRRSAAVEGWILVRRGAKYPKGRLKVFGVSQDREEEFRSALNALSSVDADIVFSRP
ncbi:hypothetical protein ACFQ78_28375, partial [Streptomyces sp. NPDC056519]|uniref:hypothetical protein n=1 Tax=Streptomyces sp. NPDC056519 TaxID=3345849 RepID=UPI00367EFDA9